MQFTLLLFLWLGKAKKFVLLRSSKNAIGLLKPLSPYLCISVSSLSTISCATAAFDFRVPWLTVPSAVMMVTLFVSWPKPAPASCNEFRTIMSRFLRASFDLALFSSLSVSRASVGTEPFRNVNHAAWFLRNHRCRRNIRG